MSRRVKAGERLAEYNAKFSTMTGKLKGIPALNTSPLVNPYCLAMNKSGRAACGFCYSIAMLQGHRANCGPRWEDNGAFLSDKLHDAEYLPTPPNALYIRLHAHGELINLNHARNLIRITNKAPRSTFTLWTKRPGLINRAIKEEGGKPSNLILIFSNDKEFNKAATLPPGFDKTFNNQTAEDKGAATNCRGACIDCLKCYDLKDNTRHIFEPLK